MRTRREVDREFAERRKSIRHSYQICYNRYGSAASMPIMVLKKGTYSVISIKPVYNVQKLKTIGILQAFLSAKLSNPNVIRYKDIPLAKSRFKDDYDYFLKK